MLKRPKPGEDEEDILRMQEEFLREKQKQNLQPAAAVTNLRPTERTNRSNTSETGRKPSKYAQAKGLKGQTEKKARFETSTSVVGDILEKNLEEPEQIEPEAEDDKVYYPKVIPSLLGEIVEKNVTDFVDFDTTQMPSQGFPVVTKQTSLFYKKRTEQNVNTKENVNMDVDEPSTSADTSKKPANLNLPEKSFILSSKDADDIHNENVKLLSEMSEQDILEERKKLLSSIDPKLVEFLKSKRQQATTHSQPESTKSVKFSTKVEIKEISEEAMDTTVAIPENNNLWENDVLTHPEVSKWLHFDSLEKDKLEWMKGIEESKKVRADEPYEARFDFNGYLLPYTMEYTEKTKPLFHHGDEPHRPGYSITELIELTRSTVTQQRVMALNTIAGIIEYYSAGTYKNVIEIPVSKLFFIIRIAMDDNKVIILEPALRAMRNLLYNRIDEASLDALIGFEEGTLQPCLENDKSEIEELQSKESEFTDYHLAEIDIMTALQRTEILQRLYYILETIKPNFNCVQYSLQILSRLARDSLETAQKIVEMEHLMKTIIKNFVPVTSINFVFEPSIVYSGKPILAALKFIRIMSLQSLDVTKLLLIKYDLLKPISEYISSAVDRMYGLKIQIEAFCTLSNILCFGMGTDVAVSLFPVIVTALHKHVKGTDIFVESSILSATHAAVVLQLVNRLLRCILGGMDSYKSQIYPLLKEGVQKWMGQLSQASSYTCGHLRLLCSAIDCCKTVTLIENLPMKFLNDSLRTLSQSQGFAVIIRNLIPSSNLLSELDNKDLHLTKNLMSLGGSVIDSAQKVLPILNIASPMPFLASLFNLLTYVNDKEISEMFLRHLTMYLSKISNKVPSLCDNWFTRMESNFVFSIIKLSTQYDISEGSKDLLYTVANKLCYILRNDKKYELDFLFGYVVFNKHWFTAERLLHLVNLTDADGFSKALTSIEDIKLCYSRVVNINYRDTGPNIKFKSWQEPILPRDWIYLPILTLYSRSQEAENSPKVFGEHSRKVAARIAAEKEFITRCSLEWILFNELCFPDLLNDIDVTDRLCRIMCVFLCDNSLFLDPKIKILLKKCTEILFKKKSKLNFDKQLVGLHNFQDFFTQFLEQFQSVSYGDPTFAACVLVPLAQRHDVKWRKLLWSEYAGCLRALDCPEEYLCYDINEYLQPEETDESLIQSYFQALSTNLVREGTIAHKIALHHATCYKNRSVSKE
ncbi:RNA polymerase II-associated protein 1 [Spodoptera frugiperda]|uniref:RNA polymerase II-associated protein 1 n=1 Tax=Spodoptera frugiperda TaxID=7108 RepID=A0A9R0DD14_SPOFR|nr:RNA polymerase II-associated protein 1 [Spodoptera frugiperda]